MLTTELEEGPFWLDDIMFRSNLTENQPGIPLLLRIKLVNSLSDCEPLVDAFVDIWSCNSTGFYSGFTSKSASALRKVVCSAQVLPCNIVSSFVLTTYNTNKTGCTAGIFLTLKLTILLF